MRRELAALQEMQQRVLMKRPRAGFDVFDTGRVSRLSPDTSMKIFKDVLRRIADRHLTTRQIDRMPEGNWGGTPTTE
jgi:hypothetical protein